MVKNEAKPKPAEEALAATPHFHAPVPRMHLWDTSGPSRTPSRAWEDDFVYSTPTMRRRLPNFTIRANAPVGNLRDPV